MQMHGGPTLAWCAAIDWVADDWPALFGTMHPQLMSAAGKRLECKPGYLYWGAARSCGACSSPQNFPHRDRGLPLRVGLHPPAAAFIPPSEREFDAALVLGRAALNHGPIGLAD